MNSGTLWGLKSIERDPEAGQIDLPDITISKDLLSFLTRRIEASGQKAKCRRLRLNSRRLWPRGPPDIYGRHGVALTTHKLKAADWCKPQPVSIH